MADTNKKYVSIITHDGQQLHVKDAEARAQLPSLATEADVRTIVTDYNQ